MNTIEMSNDKLIEAWKNAQITFALCAGHNKARMNESLIKDYENEMKRRGLAIPDNYQDGIFNGPGSF